MILLALFSPIMVLALFSSAIVLDGTWRNPLGFSQLGERRGNWVFLQRGKRDDSRPTD
ncbi:hypothetical protein K402DRAFT_390826 [Aulographum hederae CBS 113979]|uniref:Uncharacterized protein n=1 Tax=Aulographum hederae CBS 113979 TaxID=1176131 RepID=A0A6G1H7Q3_9PEZI|nr:hypothetical protein K402DRAFT_390826 [Aulographum hederae CBS 113979]